MIAAARIQRLDPLVADAIAAGEVIERPASVVKELCENALDAGAGSIDVAIEAGGLVRILVADDGEGIGAADLPLALAPHATSKIARIEDLERTVTLGFRGEALASIAAVSEVRITSATDDGGGSHIHVLAGTPEPVAAAARSRGTTVEVCDLFSTTPARLRFLKSARAETAAIMRTLHDLVLSAPDVSFRCTVDGAEAFLHSGGGLERAVASVYDSATAAAMLPIAHTGPVAVTGLISHPSVHRGSRTGIVLVVNGRRVQNRMLSVAVEEAYRGLLPLARYPTAVIRIDIDPAEIDVNVHPAKREIRIREEGLVFSAVQRACWAALQSAAPVQAAVGFLPEELPAGGGEMRVSSGWIAPRAAGRADTPARVSEIVPAAPPRQFTALGQVGSEWIVAAGEGSVVIVDPHAAHEKVIYEQLRARWRPGSRYEDGTSQMLLIPDVIECEPSQMEAFALNRELLSGFGFELEEFGPAALRCIAVPANATRAEPSRLVRDMLDGLGSRTEEGEVRQHRIAALIACHAAVRFGDPLGLTEQQQLLDDLAVTQNSLTCPHGRPTTLVLDDPALRRAFLRPAR